MRGSSQKSHSPPFARNLSGAQRIAEVALPTKCDVRHKRPQLVDPAERFDLAALLECRSEVATADRFRNWFMLDPAILAAAGLTKVKGHAFLAEFRLATPLAVFGHRTSVLALHPSGVLTVLADVTPQALAKTLNVPTMLYSDLFIAQRVIATSPGANARPGAIAARALVVTSRNGLAGKGVAGCHYSSRRSKKGPALLRGPVCFG